MFWDSVAPVYDIFANLINRRANAALCDTVSALIAPTDTVLECACGTGLLTAVIAPRCKQLVATDFSENMLARARKKCRAFDSVTFERADILALPYPDSSFDIVVAANVIHLLDEPALALAGLDRVCRAGGKIIVPTYIGRKNDGGTNAVSSAIGHAGAGFKRQFTLSAYRQFFVDAGYESVSCTLCEGKLPCAVAVVEKR